MTEELDDQFMQALMLRDPGASTKGQFAPLMQDYIRMQNEAARRAAAAPDTKEAVKAGYERAIQGQQQQMAGMALASATPEYRDIAGTTYRQGLAAQGPSEMAEGVFTPGMGYTADPVKKNARLTKALAAQAAAAGHTASVYGQQEDREAARLHQAATLEEQKRHARVVEGHAASQAAAAREAGKIMKITDGQGNETLVRVTAHGYEPLTGPGGASAATPGQYPAQASSKASDDEKKTTFLLNSITTAAGHMDPKTAAPGFFEAAGRTIPVIGDAAGNVLSSGPRQITRASQDKIIDNFVTLSTGATATPQQLAAERANLMPAYTDKPEQIAAKRQKLVGMVAAARARAGRAWTADHDRALQAAFPELIGGGAGAAPQPNAPRAGDKYL